MEAFFSALGAEIPQIIDWLKWLFSFDDALRCVKALKWTTTEVAGPAPVSQLITSTLDLFKGMADDFFVSKEQEVRDSFESMKSSVAGRTVSALQGPLGSVPSGSQPSAAVVGSASALDTPHANWLLEKVAAAPASPPPARVEDDAVLDDLVDRFFAILKDAPSSDDLRIALEDLGDMVGELFSGKDAQSIWASETVSVLDLGEHLIEYALKWADEVVQDLISWLRDVILWVSRWSIGPSRDISPAPGRVDVGSRTGRDAAARPPVEHGQLRSIPGCLPRKHHVEAGHRRRDVPGRRHAVPVGGLGDER